MTLVGEVRTRIIDRIPSLVGRVDEAADLAELVARKALPQTTPAAFVLPLGLRPRDAGDAASNAFTQMFDEVVAVVLVVRTAGDVTGGRSLPKIDELVRLLISGVVGWGPDGAIGVFRVSRGQLVSLNAGAVIYQLDLALQTQVRNIG